MQQLRLTPESGPAQTVVDWTIDAPGIERATTYKDAFGNQVHMVSGDGPVEHVEITASGIIETNDSSGVLGFEPDAAAPARIYTRVTPLTSPNQAIRKLASQADESVSIVSVHFRSGSRPATGPAGCLPGNRDWPLTPGLEGPLGRPPRVSCP